MAQHAHAVQPGTSSAEEAQQQPPAHKLVPQSALVAQASPGGSSVHAPVRRAQAEHPARAAAGEQQKPPRHAPEEQLEAAAQEEPGEALPGGGREGDVFAVGVCDDEEIWESVGVGEDDSDGVWVDESVPVVESETITLW